VTSSSIITGLIIGYVVAADQPAWQFFLACALAIISKYLIVYKKKHIFNPAAFGIFMVLLLFGTATQWKGTYAWYIILPFGIYFAQRLAKIRILAGYFLAAFILFGIQAFAQKTPLGNILNYFSYFYIFVMVIEPKTLPVKPARQLIFGAGIAILIFMLTELKVNFDVELFSLLVLNLAGFLLANKKILKKGEAG
jgi:Na+-translocating ferredoxin:NAD+ oxidoreductase RnfD subunit